MGETIPEEPPEPPPAPSPCAFCGSYTTPARLIVFLSDIVPCGCTNVGGVISFRGEGSVDGSYVLDYYPPLSTCHWWKYVGISPLGIKFWLSLNCPPPDPPTGYPVLFVTVKKNADGSVSCLVSNSDEIPPFGGYHYFYGTSSVVTNCVQCVIANELICKGIATRYEVATGGTAVIMPY